MSTQTEITDNLQATKTLYSGTKELPTNSEPPSLPDTDRRKLVMVTLWQRMREIFGNVWELNYGTADQGSIETWAAGLSRYSENQIKMGVEQCRLWDNSFPPNLGQFARLCLTKTYAPKTEQPVKAIADLTKAKPGDSAIAKREKKRMAAIPHSPTGREPSDDDVEHFNDSYRNCNLQSRWGETQEKRV